MVVRMELPDVEIDPRFPRGIRRADWERIAEQLAPGEKRLELIRGLAVRMSPVGTPHARIQMYLANTLARQVLSVSVYAEGPLAANEDSAPQPDVMVVREDLSIPSVEHPATALLIIEVAATSLRHDRGVKLRLYAESGISEYWIVDVEAHAVEVYTQPDRATGRYGQVTVLRDGDTLRPTQLPGVAIEVANLPR
jgi:Uma2 family endonuclease